MKRSLYIALAIAFIDLVELGMIYPLFSILLFNSEFELLPVGTSSSARGVYLGILIALAPLMQFFGAPIWGALSDHHGRKKPLLWSQSIGLVGFLAGVCGIAFQNVYLFFLMRAVVGFSSGNISIVQATVADVSRVADKAKNFGLYSMAQGVGFTFGPFMSGLLFQWGYAVPFWAAAAMVGVNLLLTYALFQETHLERFYQRVSWKSGFLQLKKAFQMRGIRTIVFVSFLHCFAWSYYFEFSPVYLIKQLNFSSTNLGFFYGVMGAMYALSTGLLIRPFLHKFRAELLFFAGNCLTALTLLIFPAASFAIWWLLIPLCFFVAFVSPTANTIVSDSADSHIQGEALGILTAVNAAALVISPLCAASFVGAHPVWVFWIGGVVMLAGALLVLATYGTRLWKS